MKKSIKVWTQSANAHFLEHKIDMRCSAGHILGRDDTLFIVKMGNLSPAWKWCRACLLDPKDLGAQLREAQAALHEEYDIEAAMRELREHYLKLTGEEMEPEA